MMPNNKGTLNRLDECITAASAGAFGDALEILTNIHPSEDSALASVQVSLASLLHECKTALSAKEAALGSLQLLVMQLEDAQTRLKEKNQELERLNVFTNKVMWTMPGLMIVTGPDGNVQSGNRTALSMLGYESQDFAGNPIDAVVQLSVDIPADQEFQLETHCVAKDGTRIPVLLSKGAVQDDERGSTRQVFIGLDLREQKRLELELRQAQKLESVGRLASGVAHEINTPVQFVNDSVHFVSDSFKDLCVLLEKYDALHRASMEGNVLRELADEIVKAKEEADLAYLLENIPKALTRSLDGLGRIATIVRSMKEFAHPDQKEMVPVNLNDAIQSTLTIARNEYKYVAEVETEFGEIPHVNCYAGDINQAVLNIIVNAAHAIGDVVKDSGQKGRITVGTRQEKETVVISIRDTGAGIPENIREQIFDPFFTTKGVGKGTGQGLAIARSVIREKHGGDLFFETEVGKGTTFLIRLPTDGRGSKAHSKAGVV